MKKDNSDYVAWYILALFDYGMPISNLSQRQLNELWSKILETFRKFIPKKDFFVKGKIKELDMPHVEESFKLAEIDSYKSYVDLRRSPLIGFYNRRLIIRLTIGLEDFFELKTHRDDILRDLKFVFEDLKGTKVSVEDPEGIGEKALKWVKEVNDKRAVDLMLKMDAPELIKESLLNHNACCGGAAGAAIVCAKEIGAQKAEKLVYSTSYDIRPDDSFVGYVGILFLA